MKYSKSVITIIFLCLSLATCIGPKPTIGIVALPFPTDDDNSSTSFYTSNYSRFVISCGADTVAIHPWIDNAELVSLMQNHLNGIIFTGGDRELDLSHPFEQRLKLIIDTAIIINNNGKSFPIYAVCLGFQLMSMIVGNDVNLLGWSEYVNKSIPLMTNVDLLKKSKLFAFFNYDDIQNVINGGYSNQFHHHGILPKDFAANSKLTSFFNIHAIGKDINGKLFIQIIEAKNYPFFGVIFHPEITTFTFLEQFNVAQGTIPNRIWFLLGSAFIFEASKNPNDFSPVANEGFTVVDSYKKQATLSDNYYFYFNKGSN